MDWSIGEVAQITGVPSHRLRHYDRAGLLHPSRTGANGRRFYDETTLVRLQRILLLRGLDLGLSEIAEELKSHGDIPAFTQHLQWLQQEQQRIAAQTRSVQATLEALQTGATVPVGTMFEGFMTTPSLDEPEKKPVPRSYAEVDQWWDLLDEPTQQAYQQEQAALQAGFEDLARAGDDPGGGKAQAMAGRLYAWLRLEGAGQGPAAEDLLAVGETYLVELRLTADYTPGSEHTARFIRQALRAYAHHHLPLRDDGKTPPS